MLPTFDRSRLLIKPLAERKHDLSIDQQLPLDELPPPLDEQGDGRHRRAGPADGRGQGARRGDPAADGRRT